MNNSLKVVVALVGIVVVFLIGAVFKAAQTVLVPLIIAGLLYFVLVPVVNLLERIKIPRVIAIIIVLVMVLGLFYLVGLFIFTSVQSVVRAYPRYQHRFVLILHDLNAILTDRLHVSQALLTGINWAETLRGYLISWSGSFVKFLTSSGIILIFLIFLLLERPYFRSKLNNAFYGQTRDKIEAAFDHINRQIGRYLGVKLFISVVTGLLVWGGLKLLGIDFPIFWGVAAVLLNFIPNIGSFFVIVATTAMAFLQFYPTVERPLLTLLVMSGIQVVMGNFIDPRLQGDRLNISPFIILVSLIFWGWLWGIIGMFLSVPITVVIKIICENVPSLRPVSIFMGSGKWKDA
ncbi:MAG TPA: AI-2E family transporter [Spirochaetia bacterium]|nr:AI-2E family transporter [Spirochaetia bacterium]